MDAYSFNHEDNPIALKHFRDIERELQGLDADSWRFLKTELAPLLTRREEVRGWQALFNKLNEAKGYNYLVRIGCNKVSFIPRSKIQGQKTPDLEGCRASAKTLCEVKTINISNDECAFRKGTFGVKSILMQLSPQFFAKLEGSLQNAQQQMTAYCASAKKIVYVVLNYDDILHEYRSNYSRQLRDFMNARTPADLHVVFDAKPAYYSATA